MLLTVAVVAGAALLAQSDPAVMSVPLAFAAGAVIASLVDTLMPEAFEHGGPAVALSTPAGSLLSFVLSLACAPLLTAPDQPAVCTTLPTTTPNRIDQARMAIACQNRTRAFETPPAASIVEVNCVGSSSGPSRLTPGTP